MASRGFYEHNVNAALQRSQELLTTPVLGTNCRLETVARIIIRRADKLLRRLDRGDDATSPATFAEEWTRFADAVAALNYVYRQSQASEKVIHDLKVMHIHYLSRRYQYHEYKAYQEIQAECRSTPGPAPPQGQPDMIGILGQNITSHLLLGRSLWATKLLELQQELYWLRQWEQNGPPKSQAPPTPTCTWLMEMLDLFYTKDVSAAVGVIQFALVRVSEPFVAMSHRHAKLVDEKRPQVALNETNRDLGSLAIWVPKEYDTDVLERAIVSYKRKILDYHYHVMRYRARVESKKRGSTPENGFRMEVSAWLS